MGATVIRVQSTRGVEGEGDEARLLDQAVMWASELGIYLIVEWHSMGNLEMGLLQHPMHETTKQGTFEFWRAIAHRYAGVPTIAFYEIFNEPTLFDGTLGKMTWGEWKRINEQVIDLIRAHGAKAIHWSPASTGRTSCAASGRSIDAPGIGYVRTPTR
jgi:aryl-phospho-beta-D-glucosidase BglC (GH1 family)